MNEIVELKKQDVDELYICTKEWDDAIKAERNACKDKRKLRKETSLKWDNCFVISMRIANKTDWSAFLSDVMDLFRCFIRWGIPLETAYKVLETMGFEIVEE